MRKGTCSLSVQMQRLREDWELRAGLKMGPNRLDGDAPQLSSQTLVALVKLRKRLLISRAHFGTLAGQWQAAHAQSFSPGDIMRLTADLPHL